MAETGQHEVVDAQEWDRRRGSWRVRNAGDDVILEWLEAKEVRLSRVTAAEILKRITDA